MTRLSMSQRSRRPLPRVLALSAVIGGVLGLYRCCFTGGVSPRARTEGRGAVVPRRAGSVIEIPSGLKKGLQMLVDDEPYEILDYSSKKQGKGVAITKAKMKNMLTGSIVDKTLMQTKKYEEVETSWVQTTYSYPDDATDEFVFMDSETFEELRIPTPVVGERAPWILDGMRVDLCLYEGKVIDFQIKDEIITKIVGVDGKKDSETKNSIRVTLENGEQVNGPFYLNVGDTVLIDSKNYQIQKRL